MPKFVCLSSEDPVHFIREPGNFIWDLKKNFAQGDASVAHLFGLPTASTVSGLPITAFVERIHSEDRHRTSKVFQDAIVSGQPFHTYYRVISPKSVTHVIAYGRCYPDNEGDPSVLSGKIIAAIDR